MSAQASAGRRGKDVRSDCRVEIETRARGGIRLTLSSKVKTMFGASIRKLVREELAFFGIKHALVSVEDSGALPFVIMARVEACVKRLSPKEKREFLPEMLGCATHPTERGRFRRSRLYLPGNEPKFMLNAGIHKPDGVILDLEDSVPPAEKDASLILVRNALRQVDFMGAERMVRINQLPRGLEELDALVAAGVNVILIPKCESAEMVREVDARVAKALAKAGNRKSEVHLMPIVETALGMFHSLEIASASKRVAALTWGMEDYLADTGATKTVGGFEALWARSQVVNAARAAGVQPIDTVYADVADLAGLEASCQTAKEMGFEGKGGIHPRQIPVLNRAFSPSPDEIEHARRIVMADKEAQRKGKAVVALGSKMIDPPVVRRALRTVDMAIKTGKLAADWASLAVTLSEAKGLTSDKQDSSTTPQNDTRQKGDR